MKYGFDRQKWVLWLLPTALRKAKTVAWLNALLTPVSAIHTRFTSFRLGAAQRLKVTPQVAILRGSLNTQFDNVLRRINIVDTAGMTQTYLFTEAENTPLYLEEFIAVGIGQDFIVKVPIDLQSIVYQIVAFVNQYKLPSRRFTIELI